jgi:hypothetical protein
MKVDMHQQSINQSKNVKFSFEKRNKDNSCKKLQIWRLDKCNSRRDKIVDCYTVVMYVMS